MRLWQKILLLIATIIGIAYFLTWWMSYAPLEILLVNERDYTINLSISLLTIDDVEIYNKTLVVEANNSISLKNVTNMAGGYYVKVIIHESNETIKKKIKYGKYYEKIEIIIKKEGIEVKNKRS